MTPWRDRSGSFSLLKMAVFVLLCLPGLILVYRWGLNDLGPRRWNELILETGLWAVRFLLLSLAITPFRQLTQNTFFIQIRRMIGLASLFYGLAHFLFYIIDLNGDWLKIISEIFRRVYLLIGFIGLLGLILLGITSPDSVLQSLGGRLWRRLHYLIYPTTLLALIHFFMQSKLDLFQPNLMMGIFFWMMSYRYCWRMRRAISFRQTIYLLLFAVIFTMAFEAGWYHVSTHILWDKVFLGNFRMHLLSRPAWWVMIIGAAFLSICWSLRMVNLVLPSLTTFVNRGKL